MKYGTMLLVLVTACSGGESYKVLVGPSGLKGDQGIQGLVGASGVQGLQGPSGPQVQYSGSRLVAQYIYGADGSRMFYSMYDTQYNVTCAYKIAYDGNLRCVPYGSSVGGGSQYAAYENSSCTGPVVIGTAVSQATQSLVSGIAISGQFTLEMTGESVVLEAMPDAMSYGPVYYMTSEGCVSGPLGVNGTSSTMQFWLGNDITSNLVLGTIGQ